MKRFYRLFLTALVASLIAGIGLAGCSNKGSEGVGNHDYPMAPLTDMPAEVQQAPVTVQQAYRFAVANPEILKQIPCYCGCGAMGHTSNYSCYAADDSAEGEVIYDNHALGCSICVDISQDTMRLLDQGKQVSEIFNYIESSYARFGPPTPLDQ
jgi:hypothetical protein